jgi:two-component sensor histidine kinase
MPSAGEIDVKVRRQSAGRAWLVYLMFGAAYSALFLLGVYTENNIILGLVWPANAFMLGMIVRFPLLARPPGWLACLVGFAIAIWIIGYGLAVSVGLAAYNFGIVVIGYLLLSRFDRADQHLERPTSIFCLLAAVVPASLFGGIAGPVLVGSLFFNPAEVSAFRFWFSVELLNRLALVPMLLTLPEPGQWKQQLPLAFHDQAPILALALSAVVGILFGGIAAFAFPVPALLWCAISYRVFLTAVLTFTFCTWAIITTFGYVDVTGFSDSTVLSISMAGALISLSPLIVSTTTTTRKEYLEQTKSLAAERELVSRELDHRIKNLFARVNGLIGLTVRDFPDMRPLADVLRSRLVALRFAHDLILNEQSGGTTSARTSVRELIGVLLRPYEDGAERRVVVDEDAFVDRGMVTPLALIFHELATNSTKYGALSDPQGVLEVQVRRNSDELHIIWSDKVPETGGQPEVAVSGFGSQLLDLTIRSQLRGNYTRRFVDGGVETEITLPGRLFHRAIRIE